MCKVTEEQKLELEEEILVNAFNVYYKKVFNYFYSYLYDLSESQELAGEVFVRAAAAWRNYDVEKGSISTWIFTIAGNLLKDYWRKKKPIKVNLEEIQDSCDISTEIENREERAALEKAMSFLSDKEREIIHLKFYAGMKNTEIAELTGLTESNTGVVIHRSLAKLRKKLEKYF